MSAASCVDCGSDDTVDMLGREGVGPGVRGPITLNRCRACGLVFSARWREDYSSALYEYYGDAVNRDRLVYDPLNRAGYEALLSQLGSGLGGRRALDVGCGIGHFVHTARANGWDAEGIELSESAVALCRENGVPARATDLFSDELRPGSYDLCTAFEVIEHVPQPTQFLARIGELLRPGGLIYLTTPNFNSLDRRILGADWRAINTEHLSYFTPARMTKAIRAAGLTPRAVRTRNLSPSVLRNFLMGRKPDPRRWADDRGRDKQMREAIQGSPALRLSKAAVNYALEWTGAGASMKVVCAKPL